MKITRFALFCIASALLFNFGQTQAATTVLSPTVNISIVNYDCGCIPDQWNPDAGMYVGGGGTEAGSTNSMMAAIFIRFELPTYIPGTDVTNADFVLKAVNDTWFPSSMDVATTDNGLDPSAIHVYNQPRPGQYLSSFSALAGEFIHLDLTAAVNAAYQHDGVITFFIWNEHDIYSYQQFDVNKELDLTISAVPEPETYGMLLAGLGLIGIKGRRARRSI